MARRMHAVIRTVLMATFALLMAAAFVAAGEAERIPLTVFVLLVPAWGFALYWNWYLLKLILVSFQKGGLTTM